MTKSKGQTAKRDRSKRTRRKPAAESSPRLIAEHDQGMQVLATAAQLFADHGYAGVTMDEVALRLGKKKATLYYYVRTKEELILAVFQEGFRISKKSFWPIIDSPLRADEKLRRLVHEYVRLMCTEICFAATSVRGAVDLAEPQKTAVLKIFRAGERRLEEIVVEGQRQGLFRSMPPRLMVLALIGMCVQVGSWRRYVDFSTEEIASGFSVLLQNGFLADDHRPSGSSPRPDSIADAFSRLRQLAGSLSDHTERLERELENVTSSLEEGLAPLGATQKPPSVSS